MSFISYKRDGGKIQFDTTQRDDLHKAPKGEKKSIFKKFFSSNKDKVDRSAKTDLQRLNDVIQPVTHQPDFELDDDVFAELGIGPSDKNRA